MESLAGLYDLRERGLRVGTSPARRAELHLEEKSKDVLTACCVTATRFGGRVGVNRLLGFGKNPQLSLVCDMI